MGLHEQTLTKIQDCLREKVHSSELPKNSALNPHRISEICQGVDPRTARDHLPEIIGLDVEGPTFRGRIKRISESTGPWILIDPPGDGWANRVTNRKSDDSKSIFAAMGVVAGLCILGLTFASISSQRSIHTCAKCSAKIDITEWTEPGFSCPVCGERYVK